MALTFWQSSHYLHWMKSLRLEDLKRINPKDTTLTIQEIDSIHLSMLTLLEELGARLHINQIIICTAILMYRRFYLTQSFSDFDPRLVLGTTLFMASKIEENQARLTDVTTSLQELTSKYTEDRENMFHFTEKDIIECEFFVIEAIQYDMIMHHPFPSLIKLYEEFEKEFDLDEHNFKMAWDLCLYTYRTHIIMLYPPFMVAYAAMFLTLMEASYDAHEMLNKCNINADMVLQIASELQQSITEHKDLLALQPEALKKLDDIVPDPFC
ncbi:cyclin-C [Thraustotheca clavata]|uniref:Cyclin-C n=1 Tax=Thraustotheca clavata TaxID=74557 RepID=A0A1V9Y8F5_9STRA|nr:cyclin-C [Thraustotheca clavata]